MNAPDRPLLTNEMALVQVLRSGRQADPDGVEVRISRQAVEEAANEIDDLRAQLREWVKANGPGGWIDDLRQRHSSEPLPCALTQATLDGLIAEADKYILPVDVKMGAATFRKGVKVGTMLRGLKVHAERQTATAFSPGASRDASPPYHVDATGMTREPPHCPTCDCGTPADLVGALQDVVHTDPGPVRAGKAVRDAASKKWSVERLGIIKQTPRQASIDDIEWLCEEVERLQAGILYEVENASLAPSARIRMRTLAIGTHESEKPGYHCEKLKADCDDEFCPTHGHDIR